MKFGYRTRSSSLIHQQKARVKYGCNSYTTGSVNAAPSTPTVWFLMGCFLLGVVCRLRRIQSSRYEIGLQMQGNTASEVLYTSLVSSIQQFNSSSCSPGKHRKFSSSLA